MRLDIEQAKKYLQGMHRLWLCDEWEQPYDSERCRGCDSHDNCLDIVLASESMSDIAQDLYDTIESQQQEIEQLRARVARMREALEKAREALDYWRELYGIGLEVLNWHMNGNTEPFDSFYDNSGTYEALAEIDKAIGGGQE